jgi:hypothetical protein
MADTTQGNQQGSTNNKPAGLSWSQPPKLSSPLLGGTVAKPSTSAPKSTPVRNTQTNTNTNGRGRTFALFLAGAVVGALLTWGYYSFNSDGAVAQDTTPAPTNNTGAVGAAGNTTGNATPTSGATGTTGSTPVIGSMGGITLPNPQPAGLKVEITSAPVTVPTWVVVYEVVNGARGNALGAGYFTQETKSRSINLLRATEAGKTYWVGKRVDNGDKDFTSADQPVLNAAGQPLYVEFTAR